MNDQEKIVCELVKLVESIRAILLNIHREVAMTVPYAKSQTDTEYAIEKIDEVMEKVVNKPNFMGGSNSQSGSRDLSHN